MHRILKYHLKYKAFVPPGIHIRPTTQVLIQPNCICPKHPVLDLNKKKEKVVPSPVMLQPERVELTPYKDFKSFDWEKEKLKQSFMQDDASIFWQNHVETRFKVSSSSGLTLEEKSQDYTMFWKWCHAI